MIIKGNPAGSVKFWAKHLLRDDTNSRAEVVDISGLLSEDLPSALREMKTIADQSRCRGNFMYQANINPRDNEHLTPAQWREAVDLLEKNLGLEGHQRVVIEHEKEGRVHRHVVWNRVDVDTLRVADMGGNYYTHERTAREIEQRFGLEPTRSLHGEHREEGRPERTPELWEQRAADRSRIDPKELKAELTELWRATDSGKAFKSALEERGYILAKGDRRDFCVVDHAGDAHSLARRIDGVRAKDVRERMGDIDRDGLPTVTEARNQQHARYADRHAAAQAWEGREEAEQDKPLPKANAVDRPGDETLRSAKSEVFGNERRARKEEAEGRAHEKWLDRAEAERARIDRVRPQDVARQALFVADAVTGQAVKLVDFVTSFLDGGGHKPPASPEAITRSQEILRMRRAEAALENIRESMERGEGLRSSDLMHLTPIHLENIRLRGDDYVRYLVEDIQREEERKNDYGRSRER